jgi:hypothetical protein
MSIISIEEQEAILSLLCTLRNDHRIKEQSHLKELHFLNSLIGVAEASSQDCADILNRLYRERQEHQSQSSIHYWEVHYLDCTINVVIAHKVKVSSTTPSVASSSSYDSINS